MNSYEKPLYYASLLLLIGAVILRFLHLVQPETTISMLVLGTTFLGISNQRYQRRLRAQNAALETELRDLQAAFRPGGVTEI